METPTKSEKSEKSEKNPHLFCKVTGKSRPTTWAYLKDKAQRLGIEDVNQLINNYVSREAITSLLKGETLEAIRARYKDAPTTEITKDELAELIRTNSKAKKAIEKYKGVEKKTETTEEIKPTVVDVQPETPEAPQATGPIEVPTEPNPEENNEEPKENRKSRRSKRMSMAE